MKQVTLGAHIPWSLVDVHLNAVLERGLVPEIAVKGPEFDALDPQQVERVAQTLRDADVRPTFHSPFFDLNPGALDPLIRQATRTRLEQTLHLAQRFNACLVVVHPGVDKWRYPNLEDTWCQFAVEFFPPLLDFAAGFDCRIAVENIYEETPATLVKLVDSLGSPWFGHCFDVGHWHLFGKRHMAEWLKAIDGKLFHLHLHDNHGRADEHLPVGSGSIDFTPLLSYLSAMERDVSATLEAHSPEHLDLSLQQVRSLLA